MTGRFTNITLLNGGAQLRVEGPFNPGPNITSARVLFLLVQGDGEADTVIIENQAKWEKSASPNSWEATVENSGVFADGKPHPGKEPKLHIDPQHPMVRGIALAIGIQPAQKRPNSDKFDPPSIEALTWCAEVPLA